MKYWVWFNPHFLTIFQLDIIPKHEKPYRYTIIHTTRNFMHRIGHSFDMTEEYYLQELNNKGCNKYETIEKAIADNFDSLL